MCSSIVREIQRSIRAVPCTFLDADFVQAGIQTEEKGVTSPNQVYRSGRYRCIIRHALRPCHIIRTSIYPVWSSSSFPIPSLNTKGAKEDLCQATQHPTCTLFYPVTLYVLPGLTTADGGRH